MKAKECFCLLSNDNIPVFNLIFDLTIELISYE